MVKSKLDIHHAFTRVQNRLAHWFSVKWVKQDSRYAFARAKDSGW